MSVNKHCEKLDITPDEFEKISNAFKKEEFRKLFLDYCEEVQDPETRKQFEAEIKQFESERGVDVTFLNPEPGFVVKTSINGESKCFLNIAKSDKVAAPSSKPSVNPENGAKGFNWNIPHGLLPPREDFDNQNRLCQVFDVIFHPDALKLAEKNAPFRKLLIDTACDGVEREYKGRLDRSNLKFPKLKFKGVQRPSVIRKLSTNSAENTYDDDDDEPNPLDILYPPKPEAHDEVPKVHCHPTVAPDEYCKPKYVLKQRRPLDMSEMTYEVDAKMNITIPKELVVEIELPLLKSTANCTLDVTKKKLYFMSEKPVKYKLNIELPYEVNDKDGSAKFDSDKRKLVITLPVAMKAFAKEQIIRELYREDSGVESDVRDEMPLSGKDSPITNLVEELDTKLILNQDSQQENPAAVLKNPTFFLKNNIQYTFPHHFDVNVLDDIIAIVLNVRNVENSSIELIQDTKFFHVKFTSLGAGYYPTHYAYYFEFENESEVKIDSIEAEAWENNVVLSLTLANFKNIESYHAGLDKNNLKLYKIQDKFIKTNSKQSKFEDHHSKLEVSVELSEDEKSVEIEIKPRKVNDYNLAEDEDYDESKPSPSTNSSNKKHKKKNKKLRSLSESVCDDIKQHNQKVVQQSTKSGQLSDKSKNGLLEEHRRNNNNADSSPEGMHCEDGINMQIPINRKQRSYSESRNQSTPLCKGILKHYSRYAHNISDSCSSIDDQSSYSCSIDGAFRFAQSFREIPEETSSQHDLSESCKKTVRFNDVIKKNIFRLDSSILGRRKINQKKKNKKRALQRRHSEGDSADYEDNKSSNNNEQYLKRDTERKSSKHDSGLDLSTQGKNDHSSLMRRNRAESESSDLDSKNSLMFDMDI